MVNTTDISSLFTNTKAIERSSCALYRIVQIDVPIEYSTIELYDSDNDNINQISRFAWSTDNVCYTEWTDYDTFLNITKNIESDFYVRILISTSLSRVVLNGIDISCYSLCLDNTNIFLTQFCDNGQLFNPYANLDCALLLQQQLSDSIVCMFGIPCYYFRVEHDDDTADYTFKEYIMHNVTSCKYIKLMIQDGQLPSSKPQMTEFDFDWENDWEVEMSKTMFARAFGDTAFPKQRDLVYVPMLHRMYEVNSAYDEKNEGLLYRSTTWKLAMVKYNDKDNVNENEYESVIDNLIVNQYDDMWRDIELNEEQRETGITQTQSPEFAATTLFNVFTSDAVRANVSTDVTVREHQINNNSTVVCRNEYVGTDTSVVNYQNTYCGDDFTMIMVVTLPSRYDAMKFDYSTAHRLASFGDVNVSLRTDYIVTKERQQNGRRVDVAEGKYILSYNGMECAIDIPIRTTSYMMIMRAGRKNFVTDFKVIEHIPRNQNAIVQQAQMMRFNLTDPLFNETTGYNNDYSTRKQNVVSVYPCAGATIASFKLYNEYLDNETAIAEALKYTTTDERCIINDIVRDFMSSPGYYVR